ncbi:hypothetical protein C8F04DRAFT_1267278 [Mycena alexandri]|uniref:Nephrocystin 3-like N-terminal domain-containing protein n=1 Tax=Mycena alexandri TaxID=1745969 RepID=A0AAD6SFS9_9AGAR|nr:hypothetical protein C8F04DRAFT_1267278 [Mycena alexandri]
MSFLSSPLPLTLSPRDALDCNFSPTQYTGDDGLHLLHSAIAIGASYDSAERYPPPRCHPQTRKVVFEIILAWTNNAQHGPRVLWVNGDAGSGKSAISQTVAEYCAQSGQLGATFFFSHGKGDLSDGRLLFPTIAYKLASSLPALRAPLSHAIHSNPSILSDCLEVQVQKLIVEPFSNICHPSVPTLIVIDNLDACEGAEMQHLILTLVAQILVVHRLPLCFFITSRVPSHLQITFDAPIFCKLANRISLENFISDTDVKVFLRAEFANIRQYHQHIQDIPARWPAADVIDLLVQKSGGQFLYPATVLKYVDDPNGDPAERLTDVVVAAMSPKPSSLTPTDQLYHHVLSTCPDPTALLRVLGPLAVTYSALPTTELEKILGLTPGDADTRLRDIHALVDVPMPSAMSPPHTLRIPQQSTKEFLVDIHRSFMFRIETGKYHAEMARGCIRFIGEMDSVEDIDLASYQYVRRKWTRHLSQAMPAPDLLQDLCELRFVYSRLPSEVREVVAWLKSLPIPPPDVLDVWQTWQVQLHAQTVYCIP